MQMLAENDHFQPFEKHQKHCYPKRFQEKRGTLKHYNPIEKECADIFYRFDQQYLVKSVDTQCAGGLTNTIKKFAAQQKLPVEVYVSTVLEQYDCNKKYAVLLE